MDEQFFYKHYIRINKSNNIIHGFSDTFELPTDEDVLVCSEGGRHFRLFPDGEANPPLFDDCGIPLYHWDGEQVTMRTPDEVEVGRSLLQPADNFYELCGGFEALALGIMEFDFTGTTHPEQVPNYLCDTRTIPVSIKAMQDMQKRLNVLEEKECKNNQI